jgi:lipopolysaccharide/colanic/teichoic acid biosynthesis glycosyltransferase
MDEQFTTTPCLPTSSLMVDSMKRIFDVAVSTVLLVAFLPLFVLIAVVIRYTSKGSIFYKQERVGRGNRIFLVWKFRTMNSDADRCGPLITSSDDARITPIGRYLRKNKIDELPQLWNVVRGDMSLVGPRPQVPRFVDAFPSAQRAIILSVRPGITGPTQLEFRDEEKMLRGQADREGYYIANLLPTKCRMDVEYVRNRSFSYDLGIFWETGKIILLSLMRRLLGRNTPPPDEAVVMDTLPVAYARHDSYRDEREEAAPAQPVS